MEKERWLWLAAGLGFGSINSGKLLRAYPEGAKAIQEDLGSPRMDELLTQKQAEKLATTRPEDYALPIAHAQSQGLYCLGFDDPLYPSILRNIANPPFILFVKGDVSLLNGQLSISIVGTRRPSAYGIETVKMVGRGIALGGAIIVSGLAAGLDAEAHKAALSVNGPTIACIAFGHDNCYPASNKKLMEVIERTGAVISEYPLGTRAEKHFFLQRNRLIAGMCHGLVVGEARKHSGTMNTVNFATDFGRDVFAIPGSIFSDLSAGSNALIQEGAYLVSKAFDVLRVYGVETEPEDPLQVSANKMAEGRPAPAQTPPLWQQNPILQSEPLPRKEEAQSSVNLWQTTLAEALQTQLGKNGDAGENGRVSSSQAIEAFRKLQQQLPPADEQALDARNRALDDMVAAVSDSVNIGSSPKQEPEKQTDDKPNIRPFPWHKVERLDKKEMEKMGWESGKDSTKDTGRTALSPGLTGGLSSAVGRVEGLSRVEGVSGVEGVSPVRGAAPVISAPPMASAPGSSKARQLQKNAAEPQLSGTGFAHHGPDKVELSSKLRTTQKPEENSAGAPVWDIRETARREVQQSAFSQRLSPQEAPQEPFIDLEKEDHEIFPPDPLAQLSDHALQAYAQLGPTPISLTQICERSGLSFGQAMAALTELELAGLSTQLAGRQFVLGDI